MPCTCGFQINALRVLPCSGFAGRGAGVQDFQAWALAFLLDTPGLQREAGMLQV